MNDLPTPTAPPDRQGIIDREAQRRCLAANMPLNYLACQDRTYRHDDRRPWWKAKFGAAIEGQIRDLEAAGFKVEPA